MISDVYNQDNVVYSMLCMTMGPWYNLSMSLRYFIYTCIPFTRVWENFSIAWQQEVHIGHYWR